jgi:NAD(P)-dependent dehydrogenase (short-subunit alcohol dehydrogenase family)
MEDAMGRLEGKVAIVTGAGRGIGASVAKAMAREGASVVVNDFGVNVDGTGKNSGPADEVSEEIKAAGGKAVPNYDSVADHAGAENLIKTALDSFGGMDIVVNVAGILRDRMIFNMSEEEWDAVLDVHLKGTFNTCKFASIYWRSERKGNYRLINFTSESGLLGAPGQPNYAAAKLGIVGLTYSCANALARYGATANCISPRAATRMTGTIPPREGRQVMDPGEQERSPDNIAPPVIYLASEQSSWLTGRVIGVHGYHIALWNNPAVIAELVSPVPWELDRACDEMEHSFRTALEGDPGMRATLGR